MHGGTVQTGSLAAALAAALLCVAAPDAVRAQASYEIYLQDSERAALAAAAQTALTPMPPAEDIPLTPEESAALSQALSLDPREFTRAKPTKNLRLPSLASGKRLNVSRTDRPDGSSTVALKQPLPTDWDAKVGADIGLAANAAVSYQPDRPIPNTRADRGSGSAWASVGVLPQLATLDARVDPGNDQGQVGTTIKHSMPVGHQLSVTLRNSYTVTESFASPAATPQPGQIPGQVPGQVWGNEKAARVEILPTGTALSVKLASVSTDPVTHNTFSADHKLYGPLRVTTSVTDIGQPTSNKSITAGFKLNW